MDFKLPKEVTDILEKFKDANYQIYIVGGAVRDLLMKREVNDWDFTTDAKPEEILKLFPEGFYNNQFGTVGITKNVILGRSKATTPESNSDSGQATFPEGTRMTDEILEITTMRKEGEYSDSRHPDKVSWTDKIEEDLARRDFTINAMALGKGKGESVKGKDKNNLPLDPSPLTLVDPFSGRVDLEKKIIKAVGEPQKRFQEDALRLIRAVRFATQLQFEIEEKTLEAIKKNSALLHEISWERIRDELLKILATVNPYEGVSLLKDSGLLEHILPEVTRCFGIVQEGPKHDRVYDIGAHSFLSLKHCPSPDPIVRLAALIHDIGKPETMKTGDDGNVTFYGHDIVGGRLALQVGKRLKLSNKEIEKIVKLVRFHMFTLDENQTDSAIRRFIKNIGVENIDDMMALRVGDRLGGGTENAVSWRMEKFRERINQILKKPFSVTDLKVNGKDVMDVLKVKPSKKVGEVLEKLFQEVLEDAEKNNREYLLGQIKRLKS